MKKSVIYKIVFQDGSFYVGQTQDWEKRKREHQTTKGKGSPKLRRAFEQDPNPAYYVIEETTDLDSKEQWWINQLQPQLNTLPGGEAMRGLNHPRCHYTREQIMEVVNLWCTTAAKVVDISHITGVNYGTCHDIIKQRSHLWATEGINMAQYERKTTYKIWDPLGNHYTGNSLEELHQKTGLSISTLHSLMNSKKGVTNTGWSVTQPPVLQLTDPQGSTFQITQPLAKILLQDHQLSKYQIDQLTKRFKPSGGWKVTLLPEKSIDFS